MSYSRNQATLGSILQQAGLVSAEQVNQAQEQQKQTNNNLTIGEILAKEGKISPETADFFAECWSSLVAKKSEQPIGQYLKQAALLNEQQIQVILAEQENSKLKFGEVAIAKGWLKPATLDFFLTHLQAKSSSIPAVLDRQLAVKQSHNSLGESIDSNKGEDYSQKVHEGFLQIKRKLFKIEEQEIYSEKTWERVLSWTNGHSVLTQKIFSLIAQASEPLTPQQEEAQIDYLVQTKIIDNWSNNELKSHLRTIRSRLLNNQQCSPPQLLQLYQRILTETVLVDNSNEQQELLNSGIVLKQNHKLVTANRIYQSIFNLNWVVRSLSAQAQHNQNHSKLSQNDQLRATPRRQLAPGKALQYKADSDSLKIPDIVTIATTTTTKPQWWSNFKNILLLLTLFGLLSVFLNNVSKRITVKKAFQQGNKLLSQKSYNEAVKQYNQLLNIDSNYFQAWTNRGYALAGLQEYEDMRESCSTATIIQPTAVYAWNCQGEALHNLQQDQKAITAFDKAIALDKTDPIFLINKSESLGALGNNQGSIDSIKQAIQILEQIEATEGASKVGGEFAVALTFLGNNYRQQDKLTEAIAAYERATSYTPNYFPAHVGKGITLSKANRIQEAEAEFKKMLQNPLLTKTQQAQTWFYLGKTLCQAKANPDGVAAFERALKLQPNYEIAREAKKQCRL
ncbi:MAG: tetratricopeptide repeat protein [Pleurocapsa sp. SU_5_0]|nr:tetratricopeptide repeat protein [Pleurocapsa sp. SU_5_0]NJR46568.1 tetratricopeptide repeat protein [Hyellaceae cyanobacterium CSU_1_1]